MSPAYFREKHPTMRRIVLMIHLVFGLSSPLWSQDIHDPIAEIVNMDDPSDVDADLVERLEFLLEHPLDLNASSVADIRSSGLFSPYQLAVMTDYRERHGKIFSLYELSLLEGFGDDFVRRLAPFVTFTPETVSLNERSQEFRHDVAIRSGYRWREDDGSDGSYAVRYRLKAGSAFSATMALSRPAGKEKWYPDTGTGSLLWNIGRGDWRLMAGDFHARFGQGLTLWTGSFMTALTVPDTFMKKASGVSQPWSFTGTSALSGIASDFSRGAFTVSALVAFPGLKSAVSAPDKLQIMPAVNAAWRGRNGQISLTGLACVPFRTGEKQYLTGLDAAFCLNGVNVFGEISADWAKRRVKVLAGTRFKAGEHLDLAVQARGFQGDQYGLAAGGEFLFREKVRGYFVLDATGFPVPKDEDDVFSLQLKSQLSLELTFGPQWLLKVRVSERFRTWGLPLRSDIRADVVCNLSPFTLLMRLNVLSCDSVGGLSYVEGGYSSGRLRIHLRQGFFIIDDWDDRIYVYERDAPGSFNVPAMYGRGLWTSATAGIDMMRKMRLYLRAAYTAYPFMEPEKKKPGKAELKLQLQYRF